MNKKTRKWMLETYERDFRRANPRANDATVRWYVKSYKKLLKGD